MIIYNNEWLSNLLIVSKVRNVSNLGLISEDEFANIKKQHKTGFYSSNIFVRAGLFFLTLIISSFGGGLLSIFAASTGILENSGWLIFIGLLNYVALEVVIRENFHHKSGVDDALLWQSFTCFSMSFCLALYGSDGGSVFCAAFIFLLSAAFTIRFVNTIMCLVCYCSFMAFLFFSWQKIGPIGIATMPFLLMAFSATIFLLLRRFKQDESLVFYKKCVTVLQVATLLTFYASGNYYAVKELGDMVNNTVSKSIPIGWFFWCWTFAVPLIYVGIGIRHKNRLFLCTGMLLTPIAFLTFRNYYHVMPVELVLTISGTLLTSGALILHRYLRDIKNGFTAKNIYKPSEDELINIESLVISQAFANQGAAPPQASSTFGGGEFGGGGACSNF
jgi:hypothetical protein